MTTMTKLTNISDVAPSTKHIAFKTNKLKLERKLTLVMVYQYPISTRARNP